MPNAGDLLKASLNLIGVGRVNVLDVIKGEHREVAAMLDEVQAMEPGDDGMAALAKKIEAALTEHVTIEERLFYARLQKRAEERDERMDVFEAYTEHELVKHLISLLRSQRRRDEKFAAELHVLAENVAHHVEEEESTVFALARKLLSNDELERLGEQWRKAKSKPAEPAARGTRKVGAPRKAAGGRKAQAAPRSPARAKKKSAATRKRS